MSDEQELTTSPELSLDPDLPPLMGFPQEELVNSAMTAPFYTCVVNHIRVFVWCSFDDLWLVQCGQTKPKFGLEQQFTGMLTYHHTLHMGDVLALHAVIHSLTSEGNKEDAA